MTLEFLKQNTSNCLTLIFAGWGMSAQDFRFLENCQTDLLICSDYRTPNFDTNILMPYTDIRLISYSLGVWAAAYVFREKKISFSEKIAINGTMYPVDNERGIPVKTYEGTEQLLSESSLRKFVLRMCGTKENFQEFMANTEQKNISHLKEELRVIQQLSAQYDVSDFQWNKAVISTSDAIFPPENQRKAWRNNTNILEINAPHFAKSIFAKETCPASFKGGSVIFSPSTNPSFNLAAEEFLFSAKEGNFVFLYINEPSVIIGSNQAVENEVDTSFCTENNIPIFRRLSGGGAVFHDMGNLNYCFIHKKTATPLSADFLNPIIHVLKQLNIPAEIGKRKDLWLDKHKISGTASHISKNRELHHGTLLYDTDLEQLNRALNPEKRDKIRKATASVPSPVINIRSFIEQKGEIAPNKSTFFEAFTQFLSDFYGIACLSTFSEEEVQKISRLEEEKYSRKEWNYKL